MPIEERISARGPMDFEETLILTHRIGMWKSNSIPKTSQILNKFRQHTTQIFVPYPFFDWLLTPWIFSSVWGVRLKNGTTPQGSGIKFLDWWSSA